MDGLTFAWVIALIVTLGALPSGIVRTLAYRSGQIDHTSAMRTAAAFALALGLLGVACLVTLSAAVGLR
jgi:hypothetical protein